MEEHKDINKVDHSTKITTQEEMETPQPTRRPLNNRTLSGFSTDEEFHDDKFLIDDGIPSQVPLEALAGPALILPSNDIDGRTLNDEFDWAGREDDDDEMDKKDEADKKKGGALSRSGVIICLSENSSHIAWFCIVLFALIFISIDVAVFVVYRKREDTSLTSYSLQLWFTWIAFMWCIGFMSQLFVEFVPWAIKKSVSYIRPQSIEVLRMRLSYYMALRVYIKLFIISAWAWGSWAFIRGQCPLPIINSTENGDEYASEPGFVKIFFSVWESIFFATLFLFIEKFILQLIVTSFHKKAYGDRIKVNDKALRILDRLRKMKKKNPQEFLLKRIRKKPKATATGGNTPSGTTTNTPSRSHSMDEGQYFHGNHHGNTNVVNKSIMSNGGANGYESKSNVKFPPSQNMDTLIAIPPLEDRQNRSDDEKHDFHEMTRSRENSAEDVMNKLPAESQDEGIKKKGIMTKFAHKMKRHGGHPSSQEEDYSKSRSMSPPSLNRENTWFSRNSQDEKGFLGATRDFGLSTTAIPRKLIKGGYNKFVSQGGLKNHPNNLQGQNSTQQAKNLAKKIYHNLLGPDSNRDYIVEADLYPFFNTTLEAKNAFELFDTDGNGDISRRELRSGCIRIYRERKNLTRSMRDLSQATGKLDVIGMIVFIIIWVVIVCAAFGVNVGTDLMPLWSGFIAASFVFGTSAKDAFEAIIFVFVTHPFDSGDRVFIQGENWVVHNVGLLVTTFLKWDGSIVYAKNSVLTTQYIINVRRSGRTSEGVDLQIAFTTPAWKIRKLTEHMVQWCNQYPKLYTTNATSANVISFQNQNAINISFYFEHTQNWQDAGGRWLRHNNFMMEIKDETERLEISYTLPSQPYTGGPSPPNDAPAESYNQGDKAAYGLEGMNKRRPFTAEDDDVDCRTSPHGAETGHGSAGNAPSDNSGAAAGAAATMMFAESAM
ncbi:hypothetical protein INT47_001557 [Mucor saturninus]|uniref:EF-hand domain-containing protein n=1 Tax=Mucor saturninus TaxID=64648 RepID=A0A8H7QW52_9FUNG|nr:hypothetical protein INT47_001557 [Mucor saturninus]